MPLAAGAVPADGDGVGVAVVVLVPPVPLTETVIVEVTTSEFPDAGLPVTVIVYVPLTISVVGV